MSLSLIEVLTERGETLSLPMQDTSSEYYITDVEGLDPVKANLVMSSFGSVDGAQYQSSRRDARNMVLHLGYNPDYSKTNIRNLRNKLYSYLMPKSKATFRLTMGDGLVVEIKGRVEDFKSSPFGKDPEATASIICGSPDFYELTSNTFNGYSVTGTTDSTISYQGNTETGFIFKLLVNRAITGFSIYHKSPSNEFGDIDFVGALQANDVLSISTVSGDKYIRLLRAGNLSSFMYGAPDPSWIQLSEGDNNIRVVIPGATIPYTIEYVNKYGGL